MDSVSALMIHCCVHICGGTDEDVSGVNEKTYLVSTMHSLVNSGKVSKYSGAHILYVTCTIYFLSDFGSIIHGDYWYCYKALLTVYEA